MMPSLSRYFLPIAFMLVALPAQAKIERTVGKSFRVSPAGRISIETSGGDVRVKRAAETGTVRVVATQRFATNAEKEADALSREVEFSWEQTGDDIVARARRDGRTRGFWRSVFSKNSTAVRVDFEVWVPADFAVSAKTSGGDVDVGDHDGAVEISTSGGDIRLGRMGGRVVAKTAGGDVKLAAAARGARLVTSGGDIRVGAVGGRAEFLTSGGDIEIGRAENGVIARTSGGDVSALFADSWTGESELNTAGGDVKAILATTVACELDAHTSGGKVMSEGLALVEKERRKNRLAGAINGGGARLLLSSGGGDIVVRSR